MMYEEFNKRLEMCERINEGTELEDAVRATCQASRMMRDMNDEDAQIILICAERLCRNYANEVLKFRQCDWEEYNECDEKFYKYFTGGALKLTEEEFNK